MQNDRSHNTGLRDPAGARTDHGVEGTAATPAIGRRRVLEFAGYAALAVPVLGLSACGSDSPPESSAPGAAAPAPEVPAAEAMAEMPEAMPEEAPELPAEAPDMPAEADVAEAMPEPPPTADATTGDVIASDAMPRVDENGPQAMGLGYRHDGTTVDASIQTRYQPGQQCSNCALYQGGAEPWGGCPLFVGQQVKATGWCSAYAAAA